LVGAEIELVDMPNRERMMKKVLDKLKDQYDLSSSIARPAWVYLPSTR
jgi:hypothetical protein